MDNVKLIAKNKKAKFDYQLSDRFEAGLVLKGSEVKSLRLGKGNLTDSYAKIENGQAWLIGCHISAYPWASYDNHDPERPRKLLLHKRQIRRLSGKVNEQGSSLIPIILYFKNGLAKVELALAKGKKAFDKRETIKSREINREISRAMKNSK